MLLLVDELQYVPEDQLAALITALHRAAQQQLPVMLIGAGLPQLPGRMGRAKTYAERLFEFPQIGPLDAAASRQALVIPARKQGVEFVPRAIAMIVRETQGYPYFLQEWGKHAWDVATRSPITLRDVELASRETIAALDVKFFPRALRSAHPQRETLSARHGRARTRAASFRRHRRCTRAPSHRA
ncbi:ATPase, partial [mine drainage metagenome]